MTMREVILAIEQKHKKSGIILNPPASEVQIRGFEEKVGFQLPSDFKHFYSICNGFESTDKHLYDQMHQRLQTRYAKKMKKLRQATVEPVLGTLINFMGIRRIWTRGRKQANKFMLAAATAYNLKKWLNYQSLSRKIVANTMKVAMERCCTLILSHYTLSTPSQSQIQNLFYR